MKIKDLEAGQVIRLVGSEFDWEITGFKSDLDGEKVLIHNDLAGDTYSAEEFIEGMAKDDSPVETAPVLPQDENDGQNPSDSEETVVGSSSVESPAIEAVKAEEIVKKPRSRKK